MKNRQWLLARRPEGAIQDSDFNFVETEAPTPGEGQVLVRNIMLSCDPTQRGWIAFDTYLPAVKIGEIVRSMGAGRIVASKNPDFAVGDIVSGLVGWQDYVVMNPKGQLNKLPPGAPLELAMSVFGATGITAYFGLLDAALARLAMRGRVVLCGGIANYNATEPAPGPKNYLNLVVQRGRMEGFLVLDYLPRAAEAITALAG